MHIGIGLLEYMSMITFVTGLLWVAARMRKHAIAAGGKKPIWVSYGAEFFGVLVLILFCRVAIADWQEVPSGSMEPTLRVGDRILVNKLAYGPRLPFTNTAIKMGEPVRGDVVVFRYPGDVSIFYVKRLIGVPNDVVAYDHGAVSINHQAFHVAADNTITPHPEDRGQTFFHETAAQRERTIKLNTAMPGARIDPVAWEQVYQNNCIVVSAQQWQCTVPQGKYLMMGDNRDNSVDSRVWGFLDASEVYGKATKVIVNFSDFSRFWTTL